MRHPDDDSPLPAPPLYMTAILGVILFVPFVISLFSIEPFPALILPAGAVLADVSEANVTVRQISIQAKRESSDEFIDIPAEQFFYPAPPHYFHSVARNQFGLVSHMKRRIRGRKGLIQFDHAPIGTKNEANAAVAREWYANRLTDLGFDNSRFYFATVEREFSKTTDATASKVIKRVPYELR